MENDKGEIVDLYIPRKCSATGRLITAKDHASVQLNIGEVDANGRYTGAFTTYAFSGFVRAQGESDDSLNRLATKDGFLKQLYATHRSSFKKAGDYKKFELAGYPIYLHLGQDGIVRGFHNICRHRAFPVVPPNKESGNTLVLGCKYHGWSYNTKGELTKAPMFENVESFKREENSLYPIHVHEMKPQGFIFVNFTEGDVEPFDESHKGLAEIMGGWKWGDYTTVSTDLNVNWKAFCDGFQECYHCTIAHPTLNASFMMQTYAVESYPQGLFCRHKVARKEETKGDATGAADGAWLFLLPNQAINIYSTCISTQRANPISATKTRMEVDIYRHKDESVAAIEDYIKFMKQVDQEDYDLINAAQQNLEKSVYSTGILHPERESGVIFYQNWVRTRCAEHVEAEQRTGSRIERGKPRVEVMPGCEEEAACGARGVEW
ncbi:hypothetical protein HDU93_001422 [Gonapodya sp. JEL0774]|nr:hypothetical protein HDU93_001422 [Gonapodya sp. JEL0774]